MTNGGLEELLLSAFHYWLFSVRVLAATIRMFYRVRVVCGVVVQEGGEMYLEGYRKPTSVCWGDLPVQLT
jgi:hypothetical protein